ncbi:MAG: LamB/YcsF family protein [Syntrophorhabdaceae bacterium]|nr:LamB/YcsF family protein [Syntrophorhabdaceae bacterium]MDD4194821.1 LamB/YcsF family protein [Syntrophorhabdaceae bacterium]
MKRCYNVSMYTVDLNCDMGESYGAYTIGDDAGVVQYISSANIACGLHASDPATMKKTVRLCMDHNVMAGAHPGYPDLAGFGRRQIEMADDQIVDIVLYQVGALKAFTDYFGMPLQHVKLHGALYHYALKKQDLFLDIVRALQITFGDVIVLTLATSESARLKRACASDGIRLALEAFPDREYTDEGTLLPRKYPEAVITDPERIARRAMNMVKERSCKSVSGHRIELEIDTLCIHGDNDGSIRTASLIRDYAQHEGITIKALGT